MKFDKTCKAPYPEELVYIQELTFRAKDIPTVSLAPLSPVDVQVPTQQGNNPMYISKTTDLAVQAKTHLADRVSSIASQKRDEFRKQFGLSPLNGPRSKEELLDRLQNGKYAVRMEDGSKKAANDVLPTDTFYYCDLLSSIDWSKDPTAKSDQAGYDAAKEQLAKQVTKAEDDILILPPVEALASVRALEAWQLS